MEQSRLETLREQLAEIDKEEPSNQSIYKSMGELFAVLHNGEIDIKAANKKINELSGIQKDREKRFKQIIKEIKSINKISK